MDIFLNKLIQFYLNDTTDLRHLTQRIVSCYTVPTKWRSCHDHRLCDVTSFCVWRLVHSTVHDPVTRRVDWSRTTWLAAVKLGQLVLSHFTALWTVPLEYTCSQLQGGNYQICSGGQSRHNLWLGIIRQLSRIGSAIVVHTKRHHFLIILNIFFHLVLINYN